MSLDSVRSLCCVAAFNLLLCCAQLEQCCQCVNHCTEVLAQQLPLIKQYRFHFYHSNPSTRDRLFRVIIMLAHEEDRKIAGIVLCDKALRIVFHFSPSFIVHARNILLDWQRDHPFGPKATTSASDMPDSDRG